LVPSDIGDAEVDLLPLSHEESKSPLPSKNTQSGTGHLSYSQRMDEENTNEVGNLALGCNQTDDKLVPGIPLTVKNDNCRIGKDIYHYENHVRFCNMVIAVKKIKLLLKIHANFEFLWFLLAFLRIRSLF
jgi:hypothetical protein